MCVCVCTIWTDVKLLIGFHKFAGGGSRVQSLPPTKTLWLPWWYMAWSAMRTCSSNFRNSKGPSLEPQPQCYTICCTVVAIWNQFWNLHASEPFSDFRRNHIADSIMFFDLFSPRSCRRRTMGYFGKQSPKHHFGFQHAGQKTLWNLVMTTFDNFGCPTSFSRSTSCGSFIHQIT